MARTPIAARLSSKVIFTDGHNCCYHSYLRQVASLSQTQKSNLENMLLLKRKAVINALIIGTHFNFTYKPALHFFSISPLSFPLPFSYLI